MERLPGVYTLGAELLEGLDLEAKVKQAALSSENQPLNHRLSDAGSVSGPRLPHWGQPNPRPATGIILAAVPSCLPPGRSGCPV